MTTANDLGTNLASLNCAALMTGFTIFLILAVFKLHYGIAARVYVAITWPFRMLWRWCNKLILALSALIALLLLLAFLAQEATGVPVLRNAVTVLTGG